jgi:tetratricopeptide (TPR) repeat protein
MSLKPLSWLRQQTNWLLVFDNIDDITVLEGFLPEITSQGHTLITTRNLHVDGIPAEGLEVPVCEVHDAIEILITRSCLRSILKADAEAEARLIVAELGYLALAIEQAAAYIREEAKDIHKFLHRYRTCRKRLHQRTPSGNCSYKKSVATTWSLSFQSVRAENSLAARFFQVLAFLNPDAILIDFLITGKDQLDRGLIGDPISFDSALFCLERFSLVKRLGDGSIAIHRLLQAVVRDDMATEELENNVHTALSLCAMAFPSMKSWNVDAEIMRACRRFQEQVVAPLVICNWSQSEVWGSVARSVAEFLLDDGKFILAERFYSRILDMRKRLLGLDHPDTLASMYDLAITWRIQGREKEAMLRHEEALNGLKDVDEQYKQTLTSMAELGFTYWRLGKPEDSARLCEQASKGLREILGEQHPRTLKALSRLAVCCWGDGRFNDALKTGEMVLKGIMHLFGPRHRDTLASMTNLAMIYKSVDRHRDAVALEENVLRLNQCVLGNEHLRTIASMGNLAETYWSLERKDKAANLREEWWSLLGEFLETGIQIHSQPCVI